MTDSGKMFSGVQYSAAATHNQDIAAEHEHLLGSCWKWRVILPIIYRYVMIDSLILILYQSIINVLNFFKKADLAD